MNYEAGAHDAQMHILKHLLLVPSASFSELQKQTGLSSDYVTFHIKQLTTAGYVAKIDSTYTLTQEGKEYANRMDTDEKVIEKQPKLSVALLVQNAEGQFLAQQRLKQPYYGYWGRPTGKIRWGETMQAAAARELLEETGLTADIRIAGLYHKMDFSAGTDNILEDKYFVLAHCTNPQGQLITSFEGGVNEWMSEEALLSQEKVFESIRQLTEAVLQDHSQIIEKRYDYTSDQY